MRIAHLIWGMKTGGAELLLIDIVNEQVRTNSVALYVVNRDVEAELLSKVDARVKVVCISRPSSSRNPYFILKLIFWLALFSPDVIHAHQCSLIRFLKFLSVPKILTVHGTDLPLVEDIRLFTAVVGISESVKKDVEMRVEGLSCSVIHNGVSPYKIGRKTDYSAERCRIVQVGRLVHETKGQDVLLRALADLRATELDAISLEFAGDGSSRDYLESLTRQLGLEGVVCFLGGVPREYVYSRLREYDLLVQPSRIEGFGLTIVEALLAGVPVLVSDLDGPMEVIDSGERGYYFECGDHQSCANAIREFLTARRKPETVALRQQEIRKETLVRYDIGRTADDYVQLYKGVSLRARSG